VLLGGGSSSSFKQLSNTGIRKPTKYRKQLDDDVLAMKAEERKRRGQDPDWDVILNRTTADPLVMVDGYNIIYKWSRLKKHMARGDSDRARQLLLEDLEDLASLKRWRIECVFDGTGRNGGGGGQFSASIGSPGNTATHSSTITSADKAPTKTITKHGVRTVFTGRGIEADSYIESRCAAAKNVTLGKTTDSLIVATDDALIKMAAMNAGALCMSADRFVTELKAVKNSMTYRVEAAMAQVNGHSIRPESLWGTNTFVPNYNNNNNSNIKKSTGGGNGVPPKMEQIEEKADGSIVYVRRYGHGQAIIEDRRNRHKNKKNNNPPSSAVDVEATRAVTDSVKENNVTGDIQESSAVHDVQTRTSSS
jgi:predicted RNA-binding protein with PIN domain